MSLSLRPSASALPADPALLSLSQVALFIRAGELSAREAAQACLDRIGRLDPALNAFIAIDGEATLAEAARADAELARGILRGPLHGVPLAHKDMFYDAGQVVTCGARIRREWVAATTSTALQRIKDAGTIRLGALNMAEFAYGPTGHNAHFGAARNPWNPQHVTGGSSSGSAAAVAGRMTYAALGSDTGGSIRTPAHFCGVTGIKTTIGLVSRAGAMPLSHSLDTIGPLARSVEDCAIILGLIAGQDPLDPTTAAAPVPDYLAALDAPLKGLAVGVPDAFYVDDLDGEVARVMDETIAALRHAGARIVPVTLPDQRRLSAASQIVLACEAAAFHKAWLLERPQDYGAQVRARLENGFAIPAVTYLEALRWRGPALAEHLAATAEVDVVLAPATPTPAPTLAETDVGGGMGAEAMIQRITRFTRPVNYLGLPTVSLPCGFSAGGLPVGMQVIGRPFAEATLIRLGAAFQRETDFHARTPEEP